MDEDNRSRMGSKGLGRLIEGDGGPYWTLDDVEMILDDSYRY